MLKDILRSLFKLSGSQAMPSGQRIDVSVPIETGVINWTAPNDGYLHVQGGNVSGVDLQVYPTPGANVGVQTFWQKPGQENFLQYLGFTLAVKKGQTVGVRVGVTENSSLNNVWFEPCVGSS